MDNTKEFTVTVSLTREELRNYLGTFWVKYEAELWAPEDVTESIREHLQVANQDWQMFATEKEIAKVDSIIDNIWKE